MAPAVPPVCGRFGHNRAASYATKMRVSSSYDALHIPRATQSRDFSHPLPTPLPSLVSPPSLQFTL